MNEKDAIIKGVIEQVSLLNDSDRIEVLILLHKLLIELALHTDKKVKVPILFSDYELEEVYSHFMKNMSDIPSDLVLSNDDCNSLLDSH